MFVLPADNWMKDFLQQIEPLMCMFFCDIKNSFMTNNVFEKVLKVIDDRIAA